MNTRTNQQLFVENENNMTQLINMLILGSMMGLKARALMIIRIVSAAVFVDVKTGSHLFKELSKM